MEDPGNNNAIPVRLIEDDVFALLKTAKAGSEPIARSSDAW